MNILVITPKLPYPPTGADEQDRFFGIKLLKEMGHNVRVIAKIKEHQTEEQVTCMEQDLDVSVYTVPYQNKKSLLRFLNPYFIDGAAYEYTDNILKNKVDEVLEKFKPSVVWIDGSYAWPIAEYVKKKGLRTVLRSVNIESRHLLSDEGYSPFNLVRAFSKELGERSLGRRADVVFAITESEKTLYRKRGVPAELLPLRSLPLMFSDAPHIPREKSKFTVVYSGSTYSVGHNKKAAEFIIRDIAPMALKTFGDSVMFSITGSKLPKSLEENLPSNVSYEGYVDDYTHFLTNCDVALMPSLGGAGMQQKIFEPIVRGVPTITTPRGLAGYPLEDKKHVFLVHSAGDVVETLQELFEYSVRKRVGSQGREIAQRLFSQENIFSIIEKHIM